MVVVTLEVFPLVCFAKVSNAVNIRPKPFCDETCGTGLSLRKIGVFTLLLVLF